MSQNFDFGGAILGVDHGLKFIGVALSRRGFFADPLLVIKRKSRAEDFARLNEIIKREEIKAIVLGLPPTPLDFVGTPQSQLVLNWAAKLAEAINLPIYLWDEGLTSVDAEAALRESGGRLPDRVDAHAAAVMLQSCLDAIQAGETPPLFEPPAPVE